ncbi:hypothetical protein ACQJBY_067638 [Aegilops geniculata]
MNPSKKNSLTNLAPTPRLTSSPPRSPPRRHHPRRPVPASSGRAQHAPSSPSSAPLSPSSRSVPQCLHPCLCLGFRAPPVFHHNRRWRGLELAGSVTGVAQVTMARRRQ